MRRTLVLAALLVTGASAAAVMARQNPMPPVGPIQKIRNNLYVIPGQGGNTAVFVTRAGVVLVDTKLADNGPAIMQQVAAVSDVPVMMIVNTHSHADHTGSNAFFAPSVEVVTHENTRANMARMEEVRATPSAMPDRTFSDLLTIGRGQDRIDLYYFGRGHTNGDALVVFPAVRAMHAGDLFAWKMSGLIDAENGGSGVAYADTLDKAVKGIANVDTVIPGHSAVTTWAAFVDYAEFTREMVKAVDAARAAGRTAEQAAAELKLPAKFADYIADKPLPGLEFLGTAAALARTNVGVIYEERRRR